MLKQGKFNRAREVSTDKVRSTLHAIKHGPSYYLLLPTHVAYNRKRQNPVAGLSPEINELAKSTYEILLWICAAVLPRRNHSKRHSHLILHLLHTLSFMYQSARQISTSRPPRRGTSPTCHLVYTTTGACSAPCMNITRDQR